MTGTGWPQAWLPAGGASLPAPAAPFDCAFADPFGGPAGPSSARRFKLIKRSLADQSLRPASIISRPRAREASSTSSVSLVAISAIRSLWALRSATGSFLRGIGFSFDWCGDHPTAPKTACDGIQYAPDVLVYNRPRLESVKGHIYSREKGVLEDRKGPRGHLCRITHNAQCAASRFSQRKQRDKGKSRQMARIGSKPEIGNKSSFLQWLINRTGGDNCIRQPDGGHFEPQSMVCTRTLFGTGGAS